VQGPALLCSKNSKNFSDEFAYITANMDNYKSNYRTAKNKKIIKSFSVCDTIAVTAKKH
jgi:hypothetical protein